MQYDYSNLDNLEEFLCKVCEELNVSEYKLDSQGEIFVQRIVDLLGSSFRREEYSRYFETLAIAFACSFRTFQLEECQSAILFKLCSIANNLERKFALAISEFLGVQVSRSWVIRQNVAQMMKEKYEFLKLIRDNEILYRLSLIPTKKFAKIVERGYFTPEDSPLIRKKEVLIYGSSRATLTQAIKAVRGNEFKARCEREVRDIDGEVDRLYKLVKRILRAAKKLDKYWALVDALEDSQLTLYRFTSDAAHSEVSEFATPEEPEEDMIGVEESPKMEIHTHA